jgi:Txe/YoeB family toxin of Txe-Axe toxin-antitoxin module
MEWGIVLFECKDGTVPGEEFLAACPTKVAATIEAVLETVRESPPPAFSGGGKWEAMHGAMGGYYEIRVTGPGRRHYRLYCLLDNGSAKQLAERGFDCPQIAVINGLVKPNATLFSDATYKKYVRALGDEYLSTLPRPIAEDDEADA